MTYIAVGSRVWVLGAGDPEMAAIEQLLVRCGERVLYALDESGARVHPGNAYRCVPIEDPGVARIYLVECARDPSHTGQRLMSDAPEGVDPETEGYRYWNEIHIDHHRPGDPGFGKSPSDFLGASSIGQVIRTLVGISSAYSEHRLESNLAALLTEPQQSCDEASRHQCLTLDYDGMQWAQCPHGWELLQDWRDEGDTGGLITWSIPREFLFTAAADHCLGAAYRGDCPGVDPDELMQWRAESRAAFQGRSVDEVLVDISRAQEALQRAPIIGLCTDAEVEVRDMRDAFTITTVLVAPFSDEATVDAAGVGDAIKIVFGERTEGAWDEGGHHTFVRRGVAELPEAATRLGIGYIAGPLDTPDGRKKITCSGTPEQVRAFLDNWAPSEGLVDTYGDPERGFAGAYETDE